MYRRNDNIPGREGNKITKLLPHKTSGFTLSSPSDEDYKTLLNSAL